MTVGTASGLGLARVDDHHFEAFLLGERAEGVVGVVTAVADAWVGAHHQHEVGVLHVGVEEDRRRRIEEPVVDEEVLGLLLGERVEPALRAQRAEKGEPVGGVHVVGLPPDAHETDAAGAVGLTQARELLGDLRDRDLPGDLLEAAVGEPTQRLLDALGVLDIVADAIGLVAHVALRDGVVRVRPKVADAALPHVHTQTAVVTAEHADGGDVAGIARDWCRRDGGIDGNGSGHAGLLQAGVRSWGSVGFAAWATRALTERAESASPHTTAAWVTSPQS
jgi:hypothetical protein